MVRVVCRWGRGSVLNIPFRKFLQSHFPKLTTAVFHLAVNKPDYYCVLFTFIIHSSKTFWCITANDHFTSQSQKVCSAVIIGEGTAGTSRARVHRGFMGAGSDLIPSPLKELSAQAAREWGVPVSEVLQSSGDVTLGDVVSGHGGVGCGWGWGIEMVVSTWMSLWDPAQVWESFGKPAVSKQNGGSSQAGVGLGPAEMEGRGAKEDLQWCELLKTVSCSQGFQDPWR